MLHIAYLTVSVFSSKQQSSTTKTFLLFTINISSVTTENVEVLFQHKGMYDCFAIKSDPTKVCMPQFPSSYQEYSTK